MCGFFSDDDRFYRPFVPASPVVIERTRTVEASMPGERVPDDAWEAFFSPACAAIPFPHFQRMFQARQVAVTFLATQVSTRRRPRPASSYRCVAD